VLGFVKGEVEGTLKGEESRELLRISRPSDSEWAETYRKARKQIAWKIDILD
jgi:hypothetical protein